MYDPSSELRARLFDLERRIAEIEPLIHGKHRAQTNIHDLIRLYIDASLATQDMSPRGRNLWVGVVGALSVTQLFELGKHAADPFPWLPFLHVLDSYTAQGYDVENATDHLIVCATELLRSQGMSKLRVEDVVGRPGRLSDALNAYQQTKGEQNG